jgi:hypothetical protein
MAISTNGTIITRLAGALYNEYLSNASYTELNTTPAATVAANMLSSDFAGKTDLQVAKTILTNLGLSSITGLDNWVAAQLTGAGSTAAAKGAKLVSMLNDFAMMTADVTYGSYATTFNSNTAAGLANSQTAKSAGGAFATAAKVAADAAAAEKAAAEKAAADKAAAEKAAADKAAADAAAAEKAAADKAAADAAAAEKAAADKAAADKVVADAAFAETLILKSTVQTITGKDSDDTFTADAGTWNTGDKLNGGNGKDTLNATITGTGPTQSATSLVSIEVLNLTATPNPATLDLTGVTGVTEVNNISSANGASLAVSGLGKVVNTTITGGNTSTSVTYTTAVTAATALTDAATLTLNGTSATSSFSTAGVETLTVNSATAANTLASLTDTGITKLVVTGDQALTVTAAVGGTTIATVDASAATGAITLATGGGAGGTAATGVTVTAPTAATAGLFTITTGANKDTVTLGAGTSVVATGAGNDTINAGAGNDTITPGAGNDVVNAGAGVDTIRFDTAAGATNADIVNNFGATDVLAINLGRAQVTGTSGSAATSVYGSLLTTNGVTATSPSFAAVSGTGTGTAVVFQNVSAGSSTANTIAQASNVIALNGVFTDGTAAGVITGLGATGAAGITTQLDSRFLLVTYSVGNIAQVWSYTGDNQTAAAGTSVLTDIDAAELQLVATLNGVASGTLTAANFATYLDAATVATTSSSTGQTINVAVPLAQVTTTANTAGQYFTAAADTVNVAVGMLPNAAATATAGLTFLDEAAGDADVLNVTGLTAAALTDATMGLFTSNIETINMNLLVGGGSFTASSRTPGTTTFGFTGTGGQTILGLPAAPTVKFDAAATNVVAGTLSAAGAYSVALNGSGAAATTATGQPTGPSLAMTSGTTATTTVTGTSVLIAQAGSLYGGTVASAQTITGTGNLTISGTGATFGALTGGVSTTGYTGALTLRPTDATAFDMSGTGADTTKFTGVKTIDLSQTTGNTIVLASDNGTWPVTVTSNANFGNLSVTQAGSGLTDAVVISATATAGTQTFGSITAPGIETLTVNLQGLTTTATKAVSNITMDINAGTQALTVTSNALATTLGTVTADSLNTTGVVGTLGATLSTNLVGGATFTGNTTQASFITGSGFADLITTGSGNDAIYEAAGSTVSSANLNAGLGNDTYSLASTNSAGTVITDAGGTDTLVLTGATANISGMNNGGTLASMGIDRLIVTGGSTVTVAGGQITGTLPVNLVEGVTPVNFTLGTSGVLNLSSLDLTAGLTYLTATGAAATAGTAGVVAGALSTGTTGADSITGTSGTDTITGGGGADVLVGGNGTNMFNFASAANLAAATVTGGTGTDTIAITGDAVTLVDANFTATHTLLEALTLGTGTTATTLGAAAVAAGIATVNTGTGATTITATAPVTSLAVVSNVADGVALNIGAGATNYTITNLLGDLTVSDTHTGNIAVTVSAVATTTVAFGTNTTGTHAVTATALTDAQVLTLTGSDVASVSLVAGDLSAPAYTGVLTVTATTGTNVITGGTAADVINAGAGADIVTGGLGIDTIDLGAADAATDRVVMTTGGVIPVDLISNFLVGAVTPDILQVDRSDLQLQKTIMLAGNGAAAIGATIAAAAGVLTTVTTAFDQATAATTTAYRISSATAWTAADLGTALSTGGTYAMTTNGEWVATEALLVLYDNNVDTFLALVTTAATIATGATGTWTVTNLATLVGVTDAATVLTNNFELIA